MSNFGIRWPGDSFINRGLAASVLALLVAAGLFGIVGCGSSGNSSSSGNGGDEIVIAMLPKLVNIDYFDACQRGAERAAEDLGIRLIYDGPSEPSGSEQNKFIETWTRQGVDAICIAPNQPKTIKRFVEKAKERGIKVLTWDSDAADSGRDLMVNQVDDKLLGETLIDDIARQMNEEGEWAIAIASLEATNLNTWRRYAEERALSHYPKMKLVETVVTKEDESVAREQIELLLNKEPNLKGIIAFDSNSVPGAAEALKRTGRAGEVALTGNSTPGRMRPYIKEGVLESFYLWDPRALGNLTIRLAVKIVNGEEIAPAMPIEGHRDLVFSENDSTMVILSDPVRFTKENIDEYDFGI